MASSNSFFTTSPTVVLPPQRPDQYFVNSHYMNNTSGTFSNVALLNTTAVDANGSIPPTPGSIAGRKRSRDDEPEDDNEGLGDGSVRTPLTEDPLKHSSKPIYGSDMTLINPEGLGHAVAAEPNSSTEVEEYAELTQAQQDNHARRPSISTRKSQRVDTSSTGSDDLAQLVLPPTMREVTTEPLIDEATRVLGISWTRMDSSEALLISQAAYAKWISNHYSSLNNVTVWFENSAIPGYLVAAKNGYSGQEEYYIFSHDLTEARLVTSDPAQLVPRLQMLPALHLAAPGGHLKAETEPAVVPHEVAPATNAGDTPDIGASMVPAGTCSAHEMETE